MHSPYTKHIPQAWHENCKLELSQFIHLAKKISIAVYLKTFLLWLETMFLFFLNAAWDGMTMAGFLFFFENILNILDRILRRY